MLYTEKIISKETFREIERLGGSLADTSLMALHATVSKDLSQFTMFANVLLHSKKTVLIAQDVLNDITGKHELTISQYIIKHSQTTSPTKNVHTQVNTNKVPNYAHIQFTLHHIKIINIDNKKMSSLNESELIDTSNYYNLFPKYHTP